MRIGLIGGGNSSTTLTAGAGLGLNHILNMHLPGAGLSHLPRSTSFNTAVMGLPDSVAAALSLLAQSEDRIMKDCSTWLRDELLSHLEAGRYSVEEITEALQDVLEVLSDQPEEVQV